MKTVTGEYKDGVLCVALYGRITSENTAETEQEIRAIMEDRRGVPVSVDAAALEYISSAGLRILLRILKTNPDITIKNVSSEVFEIFEMTGFTQMMTIEKAYRTVSVEGCEEIGRGANGTIYRIDQDNVVKVYNNADALSEIQHEREMARLALINGIPTAISYDVVRVGDSYGSVFELLDARSFSKILAQEPEKLEWCAKECAEILKKLHATEVLPGELPDMRETVLSWAAFLKDYLPPQMGEKLYALILAVPQDYHMIHGDFHTKNVELMGDEVLLIDMDTLAAGHPVFELASVYNAFLGFSELDHEVVRKFQGFDYETAQRFWNRLLALYLGTENASKLREVADKARIVGYTRLIRRGIRRSGGADPDSIPEVVCWKEKLLSLLEDTDTLLFEENVLDVEADKAYLGDVLDFTDSFLEGSGCSNKAAMQIRIAVEEIFVNIASYAYGGGRGRVKIRMDIAEDPAAAEITFTDSGMPYDPLAKADPDVTLSIEERPIGGLGIFMVKKTMDDVAYEYKDGRNILKLTKKLRD